MRVTRFVAARGAEKHDAEGLGETRRGQAADQPHGNQREQSGDRDIHRRLNEPQKARIEEEEFADETVERRQPDDRGGADQERGSGPRHPLEEAAQFLEFEAVRGVLHRPGAEKQQPLEDRVVEDVEETGGETDDGKGGHPWASPSTPSPMPMRMIPMFSTL